jgi:hypothetical protein
MVVEILDGTVEAAKPVSTKARFGMLFSTLEFRDRNGGVRTLTKICTGGEVTALIQKGGTGRFTFQAAADRPASTACGWTTALAPMPITTTRRSSL